MAKKKAVPEVRFRGFEREWEERRVSSLSELTFGGGTPSTSNKEFWNGEIPWIQSSDLIEDDVLHVNPCKFITTKGLQKSATKVVLKDSIAIVTRVGVGKLALVPFRYTTSQDFFSLASLNIEKIFCTYLLHILMQKEQYSVQGTSIKGITKEDLLNKKSFVSPIKTEQTRIGELFRNLDARITLEQRKHEKLQNIKKAMLEKMFPKPGATVPEVRFKGFEGEWEEKNFSEIFTYIPNNTLSRACLNYSGGHVKNIHYGDVLIKYDELLDVQKCEIPYISNDIHANKLKSSALQNGDIIIADAAEDETVGKCTEIVNVLNEIVVSGLHTIPCRPRHFFASGYLGYFMNSLAYRKQLMHLMQGSKVKSLSKSSLHNTAIFYPNDKYNTEQTRIGEFFRDLDRLITLQQRKCEKLQNIKKAMLGKIFV